MAQPRRRVSYVIPPPTHSQVPRLKFPPHTLSRLGIPGPLLIPANTSPKSGAISPVKDHKFPRHRLGISSLALDTSTQLAGRVEPEGILYSGGRDGLVISWDLGITMKARAEQVDDGLRLPGGRWEIMTGWDNEPADDDAEEIATDGDILGDVTLGSRRRAYKTPGLPYERQWETDLEEFKPGQPSRFRQCAQMHADWINDIILCDCNRTVVSASSDGTVKAWNPHTHSDPSVIGSHKDYVRCLSYCREQNWIASGSFDRTIKLWDLSRSASLEPVTTLSPADAGAPKSSVYAIATDPCGHTIASGSPERVVRMWDPRSGKRTGKLVGHTDNIRAILISDDAKYLLTGSADASIKLWSLSSQRCLHTFTHHTDSVWSLFSTHPSLEIFYSGDRSGLVCKVDVEDCSDVSEGECIVICQDSDRSGSEGINKIVAMDDNLLWAATGSSTIKRWRVPQRRTIRANALTGDNDPSVVSLQSDTATSSPTFGPTFIQGHRSSSSVTPSIHSIRSDKGAWTPHRDREDSTTLYGIPFESLVKLVSLNDPFTPYSTGGRGKDPEVATLYSAASVMSVPRTNIRSGAMSPSGTNYHLSPRTDETIGPIPLSSARQEYELRDIAADAVPLCTTPDEIILGDAGLVRCIILNDRMHALTVDTAGEVAVWDVIRGICRGKFLREDVSSACSTIGGSTGSQEDKFRSPREALETVRELIEGEAVITPWATADTKSGVLTIHLNEKCFESEVYADEVGFAGDKHFNDESKLNPGKWILRNLFYGFIREEQRSRRRASNSHEAQHSSRPSLDLPPRRPQKRSTSSGVISNPNMTAALPPAVTPSPPSSPLLPTRIPLIPVSKETSLQVPPTTPGGLLGSSETTPMPVRNRAGTWDSSTSGPPPSRDGGDYFTIRKNNTSTSGAMTPDDFSSFGSPSATTPMQTKADMTPQTPSTPGGGLRGILKNFAKSRRSTVEVTTPSASAVTPSEVAPPPEEVPPLPTTTKTPVQTLLSGQLSPPSSAEVPTYHLPSSMPVFISEEGPSGYTIVYRGTVSSTAQDSAVLEDEMPFWLIEYLLTNRIPPTPAQVKVSFVLLPYPSKDGDMLPELLNTQQSKLTASRYLRVRKLIIHVQEKMEKLLPEAKPISSAEDQEPQLPSPPKPRAEDMYEILCNDVLLPLDMTLAAVRQYVWRTSTELTMHYRRKV